MKRSCGSVVDFTFLPEFRRSPGLLLGQETVLAVDTMATISAAAGCEVKYAPSGKALLESVIAYSPEVVVIDLNLPGPRNAVQAAHDILDINPVPIIFLSDGDSNEPLRHEAESLPYCRFLPKCPSWEQWGSAIAVACRMQSHLRGLLGRLPWLIPMLGRIADGVIVTDPTAKVLHINPVAERLIGWNTDLAFGWPLEHVYDLRTVCGQKVAHLPHRGVLETKCSTVFTRFVLVGANSRSVSVEASSIAMTNENDEVTGGIELLRAVL